MINSSAVILTDIYRCHSAMWILAAGGGAQREHAGLFTLFARFAEPVVGQLATSAVICAAKIGSDNSTGLVRGCWCSESAGVPVATGTMVVNDSRGTQGTGTTTVP